MILARERLRTLFPSRISNSLPRCRCSRQKQPSLKQNQLVFNCILCLQLWSACNPNTSTNSHHDQWTQFPTARSLLDPTFVQETWRGRAEDARRTSLSCGLRKTASLISRMLTTTRLGFILASLEYHKGSNLPLRSRIFTIRANYTARVSSRCFECFQHSRKSGDGWSKSQHFGFNRMWKLKCRCSCSNSSTTSHTQRTKSPILHFPFRLATKSRLNRWTKFKLNFYTSLTSSSTGKRSAIVWRAEKWRWSLLARKTGCKMNMKKVLTRICFLMETAACDSRTKKSSFWRAESIPVRHQAPTSLTASLNY